MSTRGRGAPQQQQPKRLDSPTTLSDVLFGVAVQVARKLLFVSPAKKAIFYFGLITALSLFALYTPLPETYFSQKHNILNLYFTKIGWFWTLLVLVPFVGLTSYLHHNSLFVTLLHLSRLVVATMFWFACTSSFLHLEHATSKCLGAPHAVNRHVCSSENGKWVPGFDISGHCFILLYSILLMSEEAISFRNWPQSPRPPGARPAELQQHRSRTRTVQWLFLAVFALHLLWNLQLVITALYFHALSHKVIGALFAVGSWFVTYRLWYPNAQPHLPVRRHSKAF